MSDLGVAYGGLTSHRERVKPRTLWPVVGFRRNGDKVTITRKWLSFPTVHPTHMLADAVAVSSLLTVWGSGHAATSEAQGAPAPASGAASGLVRPTTSMVDALPSWLYREAYHLWTRWRSSRWVRTTSRATSPTDDAAAGLRLELDTSPRACLAASARLGLRRPFFAGDKISVARAGGRKLDQPEEAVLLGAFRGALWYRIETQRGEGGHEGAYRPWCWMPSDVEDLELLDRSPSVPPAVAKLVSATNMARLPTYRGGKLRIVFEGGAVVRDGLEIDCSEIVGEVAVGVVVRASERRVNSCNVARYHISHEGVEGWVSEKIRGGDEALIMERVESETGEGEGAGGGGDEPSASASASAPDLSDKAVAETDDAERLEAAAGDDVESVVKHWEAELRTEVQAAGGSDLLAPLDAWLDPASSAEAMREASLVPDAATFRTLASARSVVGGGGRAGWSLEADMQLSEALNEWWVGRGASTEGLLPSLSTPPAPPSPAAPWPTPHLPPLSKVRAPGGGAPHGQPAFPRPPRHARRSRSGRRGQGRRSRECGRPDPFLDAGHPACQARQACARRR